MNRFVSPPRPEAGECLPSPPPAGRARPLPPDQRRAALIAATLPLIAEHGVKVTTKQIAEAAGVAEGTIFRVFPDKEALIRAAVEAALDPAPTLSRLSTISVTLPLRERLTAVVEILQHRLTTVFNVMMSVGRSAAPDQVDQARASAVKPGNEAIHRAVVSLIEPDQRRLRLPVEEVARVMRLLTFAGSHPIISDRRPLTVEQIVSVVLDGVLEHPPGQPTSDQGTVDPGGHQC